MTRYSQMELMMRIAWMTCLLICLGLGAAPLAYSSETRRSENPTVEYAVLTPNEVVATASTAIAKQLDGRKDYLKENTTELYDLIDDVLLPHFDTRFAGRLVLGNHWGSATEEQRARFIDVFYRFLVQSYADGILGFEQDTLNILPQEGEPDEKRAIVKTTIRMADGTEVPVNYSMRNSSDGWRVYDVRIEGVSYIQNYRNQLNAEIKALGLDAVIERLKTEIEAAKA
jgi:phospholipid transport system substrate-binding protein